MTTSSMTTFMQQLRKSALVLGAAGLTDGQLLTSFVERRDEAAFAALVRRHGPMVWGVCRRLLCNHHDAEDAFQATFLVLTRKAASVLPREMVANWLHGVACTTAHRVKVTMAKRRVKERQVTVMPEPEVVPQDLWGDLQPLLDQELSRLPDKYRIVILLCDLEGKTRKEAARQLGCPEGTVAGRLARGRIMLAKRLGGRGLAVSGGSLAAVLSQSAALASVSPSVVHSTIKAATLFAVGQAAAGLISVKVAALTEGVLKAMLLNKLKGMLVALVLIVAVLAGGSGYLLPTHAAEQGAELTIPLKTEGENKSVDEDFNKTILAMEAKLWEAFMKFDVDALKEIYADDFLLFSERGRSNKAANLEVAKRLGNANIKFRNVEIVRLNKDGAIITYRLDCDTVTRDGTVTFKWRDHRVSDTWARRDGRWVLVFEQSTQMGTSQANRESHRLEFQFRPH